MTDAADNPQAAPDPAEIDLREVPVGRVLEQVASELAMLAAAHLGLLAGTQDGKGDLATARLALDAGSGLVESLQVAGGGPVAEELRRTYAELMLAFAQSMPAEPADAPEGDGPATSGPVPPAETPPPPQPSRPSIWTPGGEM